MSAGPRLPALAGVALFLALGTAAAPVAAQSGAHYLDLSAGYKAGDFGTSTDSTLVALLPAWGYIAPSFDLGATVPLLRLSEESAGVKETESGLGDIVLRGGRSLWRSAGTSELYGALAVKLPTADDDAGLGTGATDVGAFLTWRRPGELPLNLYGGYIAVGGRSDDALRNIAIAGAAWAGYFGRSYGYAGVELRSAGMHGADTAIEPQVGVLHPLGSRYLFKGTAFAGLTDGGPAYGITVGIVRWLGASGTRHAALQPASVTMARLENSP